MDLSPLTPPSGPNHRTCTASPARSGFPWGSGFDKVPDTFFLCFIGIIRMRDGGGQKRVLITHHFPDPVIRIGNHGSAVTRHSVRIGYGLRRRAVPLAERVIWNCPL